jgi:hypothetical protein
MVSIQATQAPTRYARDDRARILTAIGGLEQALASASFAREEAWRKRIAEMLGRLQEGLRETRESANAQGSLLQDLADEFPHLSQRVERLRTEYGALQKQVEEMREDIWRRSVLAPEGVEGVRDQLANLLVNLKRIQAKETELIFEGYHVDIGVGD